jgi:Tfp pilus assembly protein FimT
MVPFLLIAMVAMRALCHTPRPSPRRSRQSGYSFVELVITVGMIVVITTWAMPSFLNYYRSARVRAGAQAISAYLNEARQLAIKTNAAVCFFRTSSTAVQYRNNTCTTAIAVTGLANATSGIRLPDNVTLSTGSAIFGNLGNATTPVTYTVTDAVSGRTLHVTVAASGRITIDP